MANGVRRQFLGMLTSRGFREVLELTQGLGSTERADLVADWQSARDSLLFVLEQQFSFWATLPWWLYGIADENEQAARTAAQDHVRASVFLDSSFPESTPGRKGSGTRRSANALLIHLRLDVDPRRSPKPVPCMDGPIWPCVFGHGSSIRRGVF